jgi:hypothetical protein
MEYSVYNESVMILHDVIATLCLCMLHCKLLLQMVLFLTVADSARVS